MQVRRSGERPPGARSSERVIQSLKASGVMALPAGPNVVRFLPPLVISEDDLDTVVKVFGESLGALG